MTYSTYFDTGVSRDGARYVARWDGEHCGVYDTRDKAARAVALRDKADKAAQALDKDCAQKRMKKDQDHGDHNSIPSHCLHLFGQHAPQGDGEQPDLYTTGRSQSRRPCCHGRHAGKGGAA